MKTKLFFLFLFINGILFAQIPTTGLEANYEFTNGSLIDGANGNHFTKTGTSSVNVNDRFETAHNAIELNGDHLTRPDINFPHDTFGYGNQASISFWIKTSTNDSEVRAIFDDTNGRSNQTDTTWAGYYIYLKDGQIGFSLRVQFSGFYSYRGGGLLANKVVSDGNWHHVVFTIANSKNWSSSGMTNWITTSGRLYIDGVDMGSAGNTQSSTSSLSLTQSHDTAGNITVANNRTNNLPDLNRYHDVIDDINIYTRIITAAEVAQLNVNNFCFAPDSSIVSTSSITHTTATVNIANSGNYDIAYHKSTDSFSSAVQLNNITTGSSNLTGLETFTEYNVYIREHCANNTTGWSSPITFKTTRDIGRIYVNHSATGNNNGISWTNAYTNLEDALANTVNNEEIWVAQGTYIPDSVDRDMSFDIVNSDIKLYGGFNGTETMLDQRNALTNITILSGDLQANDDSTIEFSNSTRNDNSYNVITVNSNNSLIDGFTITGGHANGSNSEHQSGAAINKTTSIANLTIKDCVLKNNVAVGSAAAIQSIFGANGTLTITNSTFQDNLARHGTAIYSYTGNNRVVTSNITNSLFYNNVAKDNGSTKGYAGSAGWFRAYGSNSTYNCNLVNNTYYNNTQLGTSSGLNNFNRSVVGMGYTSGTLNADVSNCIFWGNTTSGGVTAKSIAQIHTNLGQNITVSNSIGQDAFSTISSSNLTNVSSADPLFTNTSNADFTLQTSSPAIDSGNGAKVPAGITTDLAGNPRFYNGAVDMGVYEKTCTSTCYTLTINVIGNGHVENGGSIMSAQSLFDQNTVLSLVPVGSAGYGFYEWSGDATGNNNPLALTIDSDKTITVTFTSIPVFVDINATGANDGSSWANAFTDLQSGIQAAASTTLKQVWVAKGTYKPHASDRNVSFNFNVGNLTVYGGFAGTEVVLSERDLSLVHTTNETILSGDLLGDDDTNITYNNTTRDDNSLRVCYVSGDNTIIDGISISSGYADSASGEGRYGSGLSISPTVSSFHIKYSFIKNNIAWWGAGLNLNSDAGISNMTIESCIFENNLSSSSTCFYAIPRTNRTMYFYLYNSLFKNNKTQDNGSTRKAGGSSAGWIRAYYSGSSVIASVSNNTFVNNVNEGTNTSDFGTLGLSRQSGTFSTFHMYNNIFWGNTTNGGASALALGKITDTNLPSNATVNNSIDNTNFSNITNKNNTSNADPLFTNTVNNDFTLQSGSPAIDSGNNNSIPNSITTDLAGNTRIINGTIDMGCYERLNLSIKISPTALLQGAMLNNGGGNLMRDDLRVGGFIPTTSPYADALACNASVFTATGNDAIVDWVFVELRDKNDNTSVLHSQSALLQRDGDVVDVDGTSSLSFNTSADDYYVAIKHRNHLGIMSSTAITLSSTPTTVDFTDANNQITHGSDAQTSFGMPAGLLGMWAGNVSGGTTVRYQGSGNDTNTIKDNVLAEAGNTTNSNLYSYTGYDAADVNLDGTIKYQGSGNDANTLKDVVLAHPNNQSSPSNLFIITEQLP
ncbi:beta strand repeat-containing protein [Pseudofulvibacter geojedonensis]|uniref:Beta strand repeat-containing protein n=1 Tax=Pseudofulvibacter geojedonensis TaxID=1123758 RepID=A0ABW3I4R0_9FLAO